MEIAEAKQAVTDLKAAQPSFTAPTRRGPAGLSTTRTSSTSTSGAPAAWPPPSAASCSTTGPGSWSCCGPSARAPTSTGSPPVPAPIWGRAEPEGEHILAVNGTIRKEAGDYVVPVWTWKNAFEVRIPAAHLAGYVPILVHGRIGA